MTIISYPSGLERGPSEQLSSISSTQTRTSSALCKKIQRYLNEIMTEITLELSKNPPPTASELAQAIEAIPSYRIHEDTEGRSIEGCEIAAFQAEMAIFQEVLRNAGDKTLEHLVEAYRVTARKILPPDSLENDAQTALDLAQNAIRHHVEETFLREQANCHENKSSKDLDTKKLRDYFFETLERLRLKKPASVLEQSVKSAAKRETEACKNAAQKIIALAEALRRDQNEVLDHIVNAPSTKQHIQFHMMATSQ